MTFEELLSGVKNIKFEELREQDTDYLEVVVSKSEIPSVNAVLESYFGVPIKPEGEAASAEASKYSKPYGGVMGNQTMYYQDTNGHPEVALLWPWGNGTSITVKIIRE